MKTIIEYLSTSVKVSKPKRAKDMEELCKLVKKHLYAELKNDASVRFAYFKPKYINVNNIIRYPEKTSKIIQISFGAYKDKAEEIADIVEKYLEENEYEHNIEVHKYDTASIINIEILDDDIKEYVSKY